MSSSLSFFSLYFIYAYAMRTRHRHLTGWFRISNHPFVLSFFCIFPDLQDCACSWCPEPKGCFKTRAEYSLYIFSPENRWVVLILSYLGHGQSCWGKFQVWTGDFVLWCTILPSCDCTIISIWILTQLVQYLCQIQDQWSFSMILVMRRAHDPMIIL